MLNLNCVICAELFTQTDDVYVTKCGHMFHYACLCQWLERSKTCPQCRNKCTDANVHRVYFNLANLDTSKIDIGTLQEQLDNANLKIKVGENELRKAEQQVKNLKQTQKKCMKTISGLEQKLQKNDFVILSYTEQLKMLRDQVKDTEELRKEVKRLKEQIEMMENVSSILVSTTQDAEKLLKEESNPTTLAVWVSALKRELRTCESKRTDLRNVLKVVQTDLRKESELRKKRDERIVQLESDNYNLTQKLSKLEAEVEKNKLNTAVILDSPSTSISELSRSRISALHEDAKVLSISPSISDRVKKIEESSSPYFNIKSSGVPFHMLNVGVMKDNCEINANKDCGNDWSEKFSILKKPRLLMSQTGPNTSLQPGMTYDGFGGSMFAPDNESSNKPRVTTIKKTSVQSLSSRLKAGKLRKFPSAGSETMDKFLNKS